jgi:hypothetical protein
MIFRRKKQTVAPVDPPALRGRDNVETGDNPLARRFHPRDEPDTIDLQQPAGFNHEPDTADLAARRSEPGSRAVITLTAETGKIYAQPGKDEQAVYLDGEAVLAPTELRPGDRVRIGNLELQLSRVSKSDFNRE